MFNTDLLTSRGRVKFVFHVPFVHDLESNTSQPHGIGLGADHLTFRLTLDNSSGPGKPKELGLSMLSGGT